jgi:membrane-associated protease RseP (regulator of RpoE activity)
MAPLFKKLIILFAGVTVNGIFAWIAFSLAFLYGVKPINIIPENMLEGENGSLLMPTIKTLESRGFLSRSHVALPALVHGVIPASLAASAGLQSGDTIITINNLAVNNETL